MPRSLLVALACTFALAAAPAAEARVYSFGSDLKPPATKVYGYPVDTAFWQTDLPGSTPVRSPVNGQVLTVRVKGIAARTGSGDPDTRVFFQVLRPRGDGSFRIIVSSGPFNMPIGGDPNQISTFRPENMCIKKGDRVAFNTVGGFAPDLGYPNGTPWQVFGVRSGSAFARFTSAGNTNNGQTVKGRSRKGQELLIRMRVGNGKDGTGLCPGGTRIG